ncbi:tRNA guanosine(34) transglycosylase Tgt [Candidatus Peribacteria bacterium]|nr:tRNA guanosine(34) transglycosylase Tgt [Candidatus Peribacteria bacterium]
MFELLQTSTIGRRGRITTAHGVIETPFFMPVGTCGAMKGLSHDNLIELGAQILLCNTYHLHLQPGEKIVEQAGGLHEFISWKKPILTDSGGFQVFSLRGISKIEENGVHFQSHLNGDALFLGPEEAMRIQHALGSDIIMCFDHCPPATAKRDVQMQAVERTLRWAVECKKAHDTILSRGSSTRGRTSKTCALLFGIVQGGLERDLREKCAQELINIGFDGYAIGGLAVGETEEEMYSMLDVVCPMLPADKPRYLMGVGRIEQMMAAVAKGIDMFDCVLPMREARHGTIWLSDGSRIRISNSEFRHDHSVIDAESPSPLSRLHKKSYLHHLIRASERLGETIACAQNLGVTLKAFEDIRQSIETSSAPSRAR